MEKQGGKMEQEKLTTQNWIDIEKIFENGIIKLKNKKYLKILKINPINFNLKSNLEKEAILNSYKIFLKTCNFDIQILIQSSKENLNQNIENIKNNLKKENKKNLEKIANDYFNFIQKFNSIKNSSVKNFYIIISNYSNDTEESIFQDLNIMNRSIIGRLHMMLHIAPMLCRQILIQRSAKIRIDKLYSPADSKQRFIVIHTLL